MAYKFRIDALILMFCILDRIIHTLALPLDSSNTSPNTTVPPQQPAEITRPILDTDRQKHLFRSSICYDVTGEASVQLRCPSSYRIESAIAFTAISQSNVCSYQTWDCILQEGSTQDCDARSRCVVVARYNTENQTTSSPDNHTGQLLGCDRAGSRTFFQVEYYCLSGKSALETITSFYDLSHTDGSHHYTTFL